MLVTLPHGGLTEDGHCVFEDWTAATVRGNADVAAAFVFRLSNRNPSMVPGGWLISPYAWLALTSVPEEEFEAILQAMRDASEAVTGEDAAYLSRTVAHVWQILDLPWGTERDRKGLANCILFEGLRNHGYVDRKSRLWQEWLIFPRGDYFERGPEWLVDKLLEEYDVE